MLPYVKSTLRESGMSHFRLRRRIPHLPATHHQERQPIALA